MINDFLVWILGYVHYILIIPLAISIYNYKFLTKETKVVFYFILLGIFFECLSRALMYLKFNNTLPFLHLYTLLEFIIIWFYYANYFKKYYSQKYLKILLFSFVILAFLNSMFIQKIFTFNTYTRGLESVLVIALSLLAFNKIIKELDTRHPTEQPVFWINSGFLIYFSGNLVVFMLSNYISKDNHLLSISWGIHAILMIILNSFFALGLWRTRPH